MSAVGDWLSLLSFDHRGSFKHGLMAIDGEPTQEQHRQMCELKALVYQGFQHALTAGAPRAACGVLVDESSAPSPASDVTLAMPVERSGQQEFELEYAEQFSEHIEAFDPDFVKVLVRYNPQGDRELNVARQPPRTPRSLAARARSPAAVRATTTSPHCSSSARRPSSATARTSSKSAACTTASS